MSDNEYERFEITDYDLENEFNPNRNRRRMTKNQQIYGVWADNSDSDEGAPELTGRRGKSSKDYTKPLNFVSGGVQQAGKKKDVVKKSDDEDDDEDEDNAQTIADTSEEEEEEFDSIRSMAGLRTINRRAANMPQGLGDWEAHTKGIGSRLLQKMGYEPGKGLGKDLQGINAPVQAFLRKGRGAIGAYGPEKAATIANLKVKPKVDEDRKEAIEFKEKMNQWKQPGQEKKKIRYVYRSIDDVIEKGRKTSSFFVDQKMSQVKVIDMTGPEKRVMSGYHVLGQNKIDDSIVDRATTNFALPELMHNLKVLVEMSEQEIITNDRKQRSVEERLKHLEIEKENLIRIAELEQDYIRTLESATKLVNSLVSPPTPLTLENAESIFARIKADYPEEYIEFGLVDLIPGIIAPLVKDSLNDWNALEHPTEPVNLIKRWLAILQINPHESKNLFDPYSALIWSGVLPRIRLLSERWDPRGEYHIMLSLLETWAPLFPEWILDNILEQIVLAKIVQAVATWNPLEDCVPIHVWIQPWHGLLGDKMQDTVYAMIREKLSKALKVWTPHDRSALAMLTPWKNYFDPAHMEIFLVRNIVPKLEMYLNEFVINPVQQDLEIFERFWEWRLLVSVTYMTKILDKYFFPKWMQTLVIWLNQSPNYDEVSRWYQRWKAIFTEEILAQPEVKEHFRRALEIMSRAISGSSAAERIPEPPPPPKLGALPSLMDLKIAAPQLEFKEIVSQKCAERGIIFVPMPGKKEGGKQVYKVGKLYCYIDRSVCIVSTDGGASWHPTSVSAMIDIA